MIYEHFRVTNTNESILKFSDLMSVTLRGEDVQGFDTKVGHEEVPNMTYWKVCIDEYSGIETIEDHTLPCTIKIQYRRMNQQAAHA